MVRRRSTNLAGPSRSQLMGAPWQSVHMINDGNGDGSGHVRIYRYDGSNWQQLGADIDGEAAGDESGGSVSLSADGNTLAIGAIFNNGNGTESGHVRIYQYDRLKLATARS